MDWLSKLIKFSNAENPDPFSSINYLFEEARETERALVMSEAHPGAVLNLLDGFADSAFVALSGIRKTLAGVKIPSKLNPSTSLTIPMEKMGECVAEIMDIVCTANLAKVGQDGKFIKDEDGKIKKPEGWEPPEEAIMTCLEKYCTQPEKPVIH